MKPQSMKARKALNKSENRNNNHATCFDFNELLVELDAIGSGVELPIGSTSAYHDFTNLSKALNVAENDNKSKEAMLETRDEPCHGITGFFKGLDNKIPDACLMVRGVILKLRDECGWDITGLLKAKEAGQKFLNEILKIRRKSHLDITNHSMGLIVAEADNKIEEAMLNFRRDIITIWTLGVAARQNKATEAKLKFQEALKVRDESPGQNHAVRRFSRIFGYHWELGMAKRRQLKQQRTKFPMYFA